MSPVHSARRDFLLIAIFSIACLLLLVQSPPIRIGDGFEYYYENQALFNHLSPDLRPADVEEFQSIMRRDYPQIGEFPDIHSGYRMAENGEYYSMHFFGYSALCLPAKAVLHALGGDEMRALELTNVAFVILALLFAFRLREPVLYLFAPMFIGPLQWYLKWSHPEAMIFCSALVSVMFFYRRSFLVAAAFAALCALQQQFFIVATIILLVLHYRALETKKQFLDMRVVLILLLAFTPTIFYEWNFGVPSLIGRYAASFSYITPRKVIEFFFDPNYGLFLFIPGTFVALLILGSTRQIRILDLLPVGLAVGFAIFSTSTGNWNSGMELINRYSFISIPLFAYLPYRRMIDRQLSVRYRLLLVATAIVLNLLSFSYFSSHRYDNVHWGPAATALFHIAPTLYNPDPETFIERTRNRDGATSPDSPVSYADFPTVKILAGVNIRSMVNLRQFPVLSVDSSSVWFSTSQLKDQMYYTLKLDAARIQHDIVEKCVAGRISLVNWYPDFSDGFPEGGTFDIVTLVVNKTSEKRGGRGVFVAGINASIKNYDNPRCITEIPETSPGSFVLLTQKMRNVELEEFTNLSFIVLEGGQRLETVTIGLPQNIPIGVQTSDRETQRLRVEDCRSTLIIESLDPAEMTGQAKSVDCRMRIRNLGARRWFSSKELAGGKEAVRVGVKWFSEDDPAKLVYEQHVDIPHALSPNEEVGFRTRLSLIGSSGKPFPLGNYRVTFAVLEEGVRWFYEAGDRVVTISVTLK